MGCHLVSRPANNFTILLGLSAAFALLLARSAAYPISYDHRSKEE
jgi:hypothetical protein